MGVWMRRLPLRKLVAVYAGAALSRLDLEPEIARDDSVAGVDSPAAGLREGVADAPLGPRPLPVRRPVRGRAPVGADSPSVRADGFRPEARRAEAEDDLHVLADCSH